MKTIRLAVLISIFTCLCLSTRAAPEYSWNHPHAKVLPTGDLEWAPEPFVFETGESVRYIDYEGGDDSHDGLAKATAWKHHPWDANAAANAAACTGIHTYVFNRGVDYRGALKAQEVSGEAGSLVRLTSDPTWGEGQAVLMGSVRAGEWRRVTDATAPEGLPDVTDVWVTEVSATDDWHPWSLWQVHGEDVKRLPLARTPNWQVDNWDDVKSQWWEWEEGKRVSAGSYGIDTKHLTEPADYYEGALIRSEWGIVMSTPVPIPVTAFDPEKKAIGFEGFFTKNYGGRDAEITRGMRYYLENKPHYIDEADEWWFAEDGPNKGNLYLRMAPGADPNEQRIEIGRHKVMIDLRDLRHVEISGLSFRFNALFTFGAPGFSIYEDEHQIGAVRLQGTVVDATVKNCKMYYTAAAVVVDIDRPGEAVGEDILIADNDIRFQDYRAIDVENSYSQHASTRPATPTRINGLKILRNNIYLTGFNPHRGSHGHTVTVGFPETAEIAGNIVEKTYGSGLFIWGGKPSGQGTDDRPLSRILVHHNKVTDPLLNSNDWGGIETWQGGPFFVYNNISGNPGGYRHWRWLRQKDEREDRIGHVGTRFGHAYYMDGAFKNYHFNNIAWGKENDLRSPLMNTAAFQEIHGFQNNAFNNTVFRFGAGSRRQTPEPGRNLYLGNIWSDISDYVFAHGPIPGVKEVNATDVGEVGEHFDYTTVGYGRNVFHDIKKHLSTLESDTGAEQDKAQAMAASLQALGSYASDVGVIAEESPLIDAEVHDFRPASNGAAIDRGIRPFIPWSLYGTVGEWQFYQNHHDPADVVDSHWYMTPLHNDRTTYENLPTWPLKGVNIGADDYVPGTLEDWTRGALKLNGKDQYLVCELPSGEEAGKVTAEADIPVTETDFDGWLTITHPSAIIPGHKFKVTVRVNDTVPGERVVQAFLGARKPRSWAGTHASAEEIKGFLAREQPMTFTMTPKPAGGLKEYVVVVHYSKGAQGGWENHEKAARVTVPYVSAREVALPDQFRTPDIDTENLLVEFYGAVETGASGVLVKKQADGPGYTLSVGVDGRPTFTVSAKAPATVTASATVADGMPHHIVAEMDREADALTIYLDGKISAQTKGLAGVGSLLNKADLLVGGTPDGQCLAATFDFLRITRGTLRESRTTIDELCAWEFDGPFLRDFIGRSPVGRRDAGAVEAQ